MINTIERRISDVNDSITVRLNDLETTLPSIPSKALAASRATVRRVNDIVIGAADSIKGRFETVADDAATAASTTSGQARSATTRAATAVTTGVAETTGQARSATKRAGTAVKTGVAETSGQVRSSTERAATAVKTGIAETTGQAKAQATKTVESASHEIEGALDDAKTASDPSDYADMTKAELYEKATELDIDGRSSMTKAELVGALQKV